MNQLRIISDGTPGGTQVIGSDGQLIYGVKEAVYGRSMLTR